MKRLVNTIRLDLILQARNHLYVFAGVSTAVVAALIRWAIPESLQTGALPLLLFGALSGTAYGFVGGMILFERGERTLDALTVTPLRRGEYISSKLITLSGLGVLEGFLIVLLGYGLDFSWVLMGLGLFSGAVMYVIAGFIISLRYDSVTNFLLTGMWFIVPMSIPAARLVGLWESPIFYLWPSYPPILLIQGAFSGLAASDILYSLAMTACTISLGILWAGRAYDRFVIGGR